MKSPYNETVSLINDAIKSARSDNHEAVDGDTAFEFMRGYVRALTDFELITYEESQALRKELQKILVR
ncbi:hypothetical protein GCG94_21890 [Salmonella enterica]|nr:hypothetical protein [Salmonella enterica]